MDKIVVIIENFTAGDQTTARDRIQAALNKLINDENVKDFTITHSQSSDGIKTTLTIILTLIYDRAINAK